MNRACDDSFALEAVGRVLVTTLRNWAQAGPDTAEGIAPAVIAFAAQILTEEDREQGENGFGVPMLAKAGFDPGVEFSHFVVVGDHRVSEAGDELGAQLLAA